MPCTRDLPGGILSAQHPFPGRRADGGWTRAEANLHPTSRTVSRCRSLRGFAHSAGRPAEAATELEALRNGGANPAMKDMKMFELDSLARPGEIATPHCQIKTGDPPYGGKFSVSNGAVEAR